MNHQFDIDDARKYGVNSAIILNNIRFWVAKNKANKKHLHEGSYWTYNSIKAFSELFPYLTEKQIRTALGNLESHGIISKGNFNENKYDRSNWYCLNGEIHLPKEETPFAPQGECITDIKPIVKQYNYMSLLEYINSLTNKKYKVVIDKAITNLDKLAKNYTEDDVRVAIFNCSKDEYHISTNFKFLTLEFISRPDKFEKFFNASFQKNTSQPISDTEAKIKAMWKQSSNS